jgi:hypothetical protein
MRELLEELQDNGSGLSDEERAGRRRELDELRERFSEELKAVQQPFDELKARHPGRFK